MEYIVSLRYKLRMFGIRIDGPATVFCDIKTCVDCSSKMEATLNKKHSSLAYHAVMNTVATGIMRVAWIESSENLADPLTKQLTASQREYLFGNWTY